MEENKNFDEIAKRDLENREFTLPSQRNENQEEISQETVKPTSLGKAREYQNERDDEPALLPGYHEIWSSNFPSKGLFYPENARFFIRAASVKEIRHFSTMNDEDPYSVDEALTEIVKGCLMMRYPGKQASFKDLKEEDRIYVIMTIRELTFAEGENRIAIPKSCDECNHDNEFILGKDSFEATDIPESMMKYYDPELKKFTVQTKSSGDITIAPPAIGVMMEVTKWIKKQREEGKKLDASFVKLLPYLIQDWRGFNSETIKNLEVEFLQWSATKYQTYNKISEWVKVGVKEELKKYCDKCGSEVTAPVSFPGGIKSLFVVSDISGELL